MLKLLMACTLLNFIQVVQRSSNHFNDIYDKTKSKEIISFALECVCTFIDIAIQIVSLQFIDSLITMDVHKVKLPCNNCKAKVYWQTQ